ncbi:MAG: hypothetical protein DCF20_15470 [Pseudanabaena sp.]|nr:MAG: hypothetical protein DCF20_15470 [Pseudanabaena sp.]
MTPDPNLGKDGVDDDLSLPDHKQIYANGFYTAVSPVDVVVGLTRNGQNTAVLNLSFSLAKTLAFNLLEVVEDFEEKLGIEFPTLDKIFEHFNEPDEVDSNEKQEESD